MPAAFADALEASCSRRRALIEGGSCTAYRLFDGAGDGTAGIYVDRLGPAAVLNVYDDARWSERQVDEAAHAILARLHAYGVQAVYVKRFSKDRSRLGGKPPAESTSSKPRAGITLPESLVVDEYGRRFEVRPYDGFSTGLFLEHRDHRRALAERGVASVLNLFAYTCAFSVALASSGAQVTNVDVSARYLDWGRRNHDLNDPGASAVRFKRMDAMAFLDYAARHEAERFDLIILDPPTFGAGNPRRNVRPWKAMADYPKLLAASVPALSPGGIIFAATNTRELAAGLNFRRMIEGSLGAVDWETLPPWPIDVRERGRVAAALFRPRGGSMSAARSRQRSATPARRDGRSGQGRARR